MRRDTLLTLGVCVLILVALGLKSSLTLLPPVRSHNAPAQFDAERAKARLAFVLGDQRPHPADSEADDAIRARLGAALRQIGLQPIVRDQFACNDFQKARLVACARVRNVIAVLGPRSGKALLLSAHYDSVPVGPGASDDGIGVATLLEVGSLLKNRPLKRPVILLFNEGEELGLVGARAFLADPLSRDVDSLLNFEARGVTGPATMFETNDPNGAAIAAYASAVPHPFASSLSTDVARLIPNDTDVTTYKERGWLTLNSAIMGNETRYHSPGDDLAGLDTRSLQDMGDEALALATKLSGGAPQAHGSRIFLDLQQRLFIQLPVAAGAAALAIMLLLFGAIGWRRGGLVSSAAIVLGAIVLGSASAWLAMTAMAALRAGIFWRAHPETSFLALYATALTAELAVLAVAARNTDTARLRVAFWFVFLFLGAALALVAPGGMIYFLLPPLIVLVGIALGSWSRRGEIIAGVLAVVVLFLIWSELLTALEELFSPGPLWVAAPVAAIVIAAALIEAHGLMRRSDRRATVGGAAALALLVWIAAGIAPAYSQDHQQRFTIEHVTELPSRGSFWSILNDGAPLPATYRGIGNWTRGKLPFSDRERWMAAAPSMPGIQAPSVQPLEILQSGDERRINLRLTANGAERIVLVAPAAAHIRTAGVDGYARPITDESSSGRFTISCTGRSCEGMQLTIDAVTSKPVALTIVGSRNGLPPSAAPLVDGRPATARPQYTPDETLAIGHASL